MLEPTATPTATGRRRRRRQPQLQVTDAHQGRAAAERRPRGGRQRVRRLASARPRVTIVDAKTGKGARPTPEDRHRRRRRRGRLRLASGSPSRASNRSCGSMPRTGRRSATGSRSTCDPGAIAVSEDAVWVGLHPGTSSPTSCSSSTARPGGRSASVDYPYGIASLDGEPDGALGRGPPPRDHVQRADPRPASRCTRRAASATRPRGHRLRPRLAVDRRRPTTTWSTRSASPNGEPIPIAVGQFPRQLALAGEHGLRHQLQLERPLRDRRQELARRSASRSVVPANPFSIATADGDACG